MAKSTNFGYYDENGKDKNVYNEWNEWKEKISGAHYVKFKSAEERAAFEDFIESKKQEKSTRKGSSTTMDSDKESVDKILKNEGNMIDDGTWKDYLFKNITCEDLSNYDALCVSDGSDDNGVNKYASFGAIVIPLENGKMKVSENGKDRYENIIIQSAFLKDNEDNKSFTRVLYDEKGNKIDEKLEPHNIILEDDVSNKIGKGEKYIFKDKRGSNHAEAEGLTRVIELCGKKGWTNILFICDCETLLKAINRGDSDTPTNTRAINKKNENGVTIKLTKVGSHDNAVIGKLNEYGRVNETDSYSNDKSRLYVLLNDLADLMAKAELPVKDETAKQNRCSFHLIPNKDDNGNEEYIKFEIGNPQRRKSVVDDIYNKNIPTEDKDDKEGRRTITREIVKSVLPLIEQAISNGNSNYRI